MVWKQADIDKVFEDQSKKFDYLIDVQSDVALWCLTHLNVNLFDNQIEIVDRISDLSCKYILLAASRSSGKTYGISVGLIKLCVDNAPFHVGIFAPKFDQASRLLKQVKDILKSSEVSDDIVWEECTNSKLIFKNGSTMISNSASEVSNVEGIHVDCAVIDEAHKVSDLSISQKILPMVASSKVGKVVKLGVALYKNHFWRSFNDPQYTHLLYKWHDCPNLLKGGSIVVAGKEYSRYVIDRMPLVIKQQVFPDNLELWTSTSDTTEIDFRTQYLIEWQDGIDKALTEQDQRMLASGTHCWLNGGLITDTYFAGLDTAGGSANGSTSGDLDFTSLSIFRKTGPNVKEKVFHAEWKGDITQAINEIYDLINPQTGRFKCQFTVVDYSNIGIAIVESYKKLGIPMEGITFGSSEKTSSKNYKNAMFDQFLFELRAGRVKYPGADIDKIKILKKAQTEWGMLERHSSLGINSKIFVPEQDGHDDTVMSDLMAVWAADKHLTFMHTNGPAVTQQLPMPQNVGSVLNPQHNPTGKPWWVQEFNQK